MKYLSSLKQKNLSGKTCLLRVDFNVKNDGNGGINHDNLRIEAAMPTIKFLIKKGVKVVILSHRGRPSKVSSLKFQISRYTLRPFAKILSKLLKKPVRFMDFRKGFNASKIREIIASTRDSIFLLENLRFLPGEEKNYVKFARKLASLGDFYVNDAFSVSHRENASVTAITKYLPSYAGLALESEIMNLSLVMKRPRKPLIIILGGAKISDKIGVIKNFLKKADKFLVGGGVANTFFAAQNLPLDDSLYENKMIPLARQLLKYKKIILPVDSAVKKGKILDIGPETAKKYAAIIKKAGTIIWNGPMGYIEEKQFRKGSEAILKAIFESRAFVIIGGGETTSLLKLKTHNLKHNIFISTGGGAMLEYLAGKKLPGLAALNLSRVSFATDWNN